MERRSFRKDVTAAAWWSCFLLFFFAFSSQAKAANLVGNIALRLRLDFKLEAASSPPTCIVDTRGPEKLSVFRAVTLVDAGFGSVCSEVLAVDDVSFLAPVAFSLDLHRQKQNCS